MINGKLNAHVAVISHKRPENIMKMEALTGGCTFYVNKGERDNYILAGASLVVECGENICAARNQAIKDARSFKLPSVQVSDDLKSIKKVQLLKLDDGAPVYRLDVVDFDYTVQLLIKELTKMNYFYGGVAVSSNRLNYTGTDVTYDKLIVNDLICVMPDGEMFDEGVALKEDYDFTLRNLINPGGLVRLNNILCDFPHRDNKGGANLYRNSDSEHMATEKLYAKWGNLIMPHKTREGQISINYKALKLKVNGQTNLF